MKKDKEKEKIIKNKSNKLIIEINKFIKILNIDEDYKTRINNQIKQIINSLIIVDFINNQKEQDKTRKG